MDISQFADAAYQSLQIVVWGIVCVGQLVRASQFEPMISACSLERKKRGKGGIRLLFSQAMLTSLSRWSLLSR